MSLGEHRFPENDAPSARSPWASRQVYPVGGREKSDWTQFERMSCSFGGQRHVESLKARVEEQIAGVQYVSSLLQLSRREQAELERRVRRCVRKLTCVTPRTTMSAYERRV